MSMLGDNEELAWEAAEPLVRELLSACSPGGPDGDASRPPDTTAAAVRPQCPLHAASSDHALLLRRQVSVRATRQVRRLSAAAEQRLLMLIRKRLLPVALKS